MDWFSIFYQQKGNHCWKPLFVYSYIIVIKYKEIKYEFRHYIKYYIDIVMHMLVQINWKIFNEIISDSIRRETRKYEQRIWLMRPVVIHYLSDK